MDSVTFTIDKNLDDQRFRPNVLYTVIYPKDVKAECIEEDFTEQNISDSLSLPSSAVAKTSQPQLSVLPPKDSCLPIPTSTRQDVKAECIEEDFTEQNISDSLSLPSSAVAKASQPQLSVLPPIGSCLPIRTSTRQDVKAKCIDKNFTKQNISYPLSLPSSAVAKASQPRLFVLPSCLSTQTSTRDNTVHHTFKQLSKYHKVSQLSKYHKVSQTITVVQISQSIIKKSNPRSILHATTSEVSWTCPKCPMKFKTHTDYLCHSKLYHGKFECKFCPLVLNSQAACNEHTSATHLKFKCTICSNCFLTESGLKSHHVKVHKINQCKYCNLQLDSVKACYEHIKSTHLSGSFPQLFCF